MSDSPDDRTQRSSDTVRRPLEFWSPAVHGLLTFLETTDFPAPRLLAVDGSTEILTWLEGTSGPDGWAEIVPEEGLRCWARFLRRYHDTVAAYRPHDDAVWSSRAGTCEAGELICHGDFGPWNGVWDGGRPVGLIDFDHARPAAPMFDIAYALEYAAPFRDDDECVRWLRYPGPPDRSRRIEIFCAAYGTDVPPDVVELVAAQQRAVRDTCRELAERGIEPQATWVRDGHLEAIDARIAFTESVRL